MKTWEQFFNELSRDELIEIIQNDLQLCRDGFIDDCLLRKTARAWSLNVSLSQTTASAMIQVANEAYKKIALEALEGKNNC